MMKYPTTAALVVLLALLISHKNGIAEVPLSDFLWNQTVPLHKAALFSHYIQGLEDVSLDPTEFGAYNIQDAVYMYWFKESIDIAANRTSDPALKLFLQNKSKSHEKEYTEAFEKWHIKDPNGIQLGTACQKYVDHLVNVSKTMDGNYLVTALIPCARLWPWLGQQIHVGSKTFGVYTDWARENLNPTYVGYTSYEDVINAAYVKGTITKKQALQVYSESMVGEVAFFDSVHRDVQHGHHGKF